MNGVPVQEAKPPEGGKVPKVLLVAPLPPPFGGICYLTRALLDAGLGQGFQLVHLNISKNTLREEFGKVTLLDVWLALRNLTRFSWLLVRERPQVVYVQSTADTGFYRDWVFITTARLANCKVLLHLHGTRHSAPFKSGWFHSHLVRWSLSCANYVIVPTKADLAGYLDYGLKVPVEVIHNTAYAPPEFQDRVRQTRLSNTVSLIGIGRLSEAKGSWDLFRALALVRQCESNVRLTWVGLGAFPSDDEYAHQLCASLGLTDHITLAGQLSDEEKFFELSRADILVLPTHTEGFPLSLLEGMAMGLPVVTTPVGGIPEIVKDGVNGYLVSPKDVEMLAERILTLVKEPGKRQRMGEANARLYREQLSAHKVVARIHTLLRELI
jgi:glycosyltransferase involved in cell wall biosynthesis